MFSPLQQKHIAIGIVSTLRAEWNANNEDAFPTPQELWDRLDNAIAQVTADEDEQEIIGRIVTDDSDEYLALFDIVESNAIDRGRWARLAGMFGPMVDGVFLPL